MIVPKLAFVIPYRDRVNQKKDFINNMNKLLLENSITDYIFLFVEQNDERVFNRGAMKNFGYLYLKDRYPDHYQEINIIFNDIDTYPNEYVDYSTSNGFVKHFFGYKHTLGGIVSIKGADYEKIGGFPNLWGWGYEDNELQDRVVKNKLEIDRSNFTHIDDVSLNKYRNGLSNPIKLVCERSNNIYLREKEMLDTFNDLKKYSWQFIEEECILKINTFECIIPYSDIQLKYIDLGKMTTTSLKPTMDSFRKNWNNLFNFK